ncbi:DNA-binding response regulator [Cohnella sp.]|uniref:DNA-binding response regulator n=1 Tax=Cohnella sp. TaxID=1883426 RepID=UPI0035658271
MINGRVGGKNDGLFEVQYQQWMSAQRKSRSGEALRRLNEGHGHAEKLFVEDIWWPAIGSLDFLHAEYEVTNYREGSYFLDHAYVREPHWIDWEVDDFSTHAKMMDRRGFNYERDRQNQLVFQSWHVYRFPLDLIKERPRQCQQLVLQVMGKLYGAGKTDEPSLSLKHREIMRLAIRLQRPFTPGEVCIQLGISNRHTRDLLHELVNAGLLEIVGGHERARSFRVTIRGRTLYLG